MGLGLAALGRPGYINICHSFDTPGDLGAGAMRSRTMEVLDAAYDAGVRYVDAARSYGRAEEFLAGWLDARRVPRGAVTVGSKWGYTYTADWKVEAEAHEVKNHSLGSLLRQYAESRALLGDHLDLYQIHSATLETGVLDDAGVLGELVRMKESGLAIGLSLSGPSQAETLRRAMGARADGVRVFDAVQATWNLLERSAGDALAEAHAAGLAVIVKEALANGRLTTRNLDPAFASGMGVLVAEAARLNTTPDALAIAGVLARPWVDVVLSGAADVSQLRSNLAATSVAWDGEAEERLAGIAERSTDYWATRSRLPWN